jgi:apolipoprotein N-acyltransferase
MQNQLETLDLLGITLPSPAYIVGAIVFGIIGLVAFVHGKRAGRPRTRWLGLALMLYPYVVWQTWLLYLVGIGLTLAVWFDRNSS